MARAAAASNIRRNPDLARALLKTSDDEVVAALFGDPNDADWAFPDRAAFRTAMAAEIDAALALGEAA